MVTRRWAPTVRSSALDLLIPLTWLIAERSRFGAGLDLVDFEFGSCLDRVWIYWRDLFQGTRVQQLTVTTRSVHKATKLTCCQSLVALALYLASLEAAAKAVVERIHGQH